MTRMLHRGLCWSLFGNVAIHCHLHGVCLDAVWFDWESSIASCNTV